MYYVNNINIITTYLLKNSNEYNIFFLGDILILKMNQNYNHNN